MQNYYNRQNEFDNIERIEFLNYLKKTGKTNSNFQPISNDNQDFLTDKIGQEYKAIKTPQTYFSRKYNGTLTPIDNSNNYYYDYYSLGKGGIPFGDYQKRNYNQKIFSPPTFRNNRMNLENDNYEYKKSKFYNNNQLINNNTQFNNNNQFNKDKYLYYSNNQIKQNIDLNYNNNQINQNNNLDYQINKNQVNDNYSNYDNKLKEDNNYNLQIKSINTNYDIEKKNNSINNNINYNNFNNENMNTPLQNNYYERNKKEQISKSMNEFDFQEYKRRIEERERQLIGKYEDYHNIKVEKVNRYNYNFNNNNYSTNQSNYLINEDNYNINTPPKYPEGTEFYIDYTNYARYPKNIRHFNQNKNQYNI